MKVSKLQELLSQQDQNMEVVIFGHEEGYDPVAKLSIQAVHPRRKSKEWYNGKHKHHGTSYCFACRQDGRRRSIRNVLLLKKG